MVFFLETMGNKRVGVLLLCLFTVLSHASEENYALREEDCFTLHFESLKHKASPSYFNFLTVFHNYLTLELALNAPDAFNGFMSLSTSSSPSFQQLSDVKDVLYKGCECKMASKPKQKKHKGKKPKKGELPQLDSSCGIPYAFYFLGNMFKALPNKEEALSCYTTAYQINPAFGEAFTVAGSILLEEGYPMEAQTHFQRAIEIFPRKYFVYYYNALALSALHRDEESSEMFEKAVDLSTSDGEKFSVLLTYATACHKSSRKSWSKAEELYRQAIEIAPTVSPVSLSRVQSHYGAFLKDQGDYNRSVLYLNAAVTGDPTQCGYRINLGHALESRNIPGDNAQALEQYESKACESNIHAKCDAFVTRQKLCAWHKAVNWTRDIETVSQAALSTDIPCITPAMSLFSQLSDPIIELEIAKNHAKVAERKVHTRYKHSPAKLGDDFAQQLDRLHSNGVASDVKIHSRIKIGYISWYFSEHIVGYITEALLPLHKSKIFEVYLYALNTKSDKVKVNLATLVEHFVDVSLLHYSEVAEQIFSDKILILINLDGHMPGMPQEILAHLPAPIQISFLGFPGSSGSNYTQYIVADKTVIPPTPDFQKYYTEQIIYMPYSFFPAHHSIVHSNLTIVPASEKNQNFTFCSINQLIKLDPNTLAAWKRILSRVPNSVLWLQKHPPDAVPFLQEAAPTSSIIFLDRNASIQEYMNQMKKCDLFLDPPKYNSHSTGADSLWMGVPFLTVPGTRYASRVGASLLHALECESPTWPDLLKLLVASNLEDYEDLAVRLGSDYTLWQTIKAALVACTRSSPLFRPSLWMQHWENGLIEAAYKYSQDFPPAHIVVK